MSQDARAFIDDLYRSESTKVLATLVRLVGDIELAEDATQDAFAAAFRQWPKDGVPANPRAWLISTGRFKAIDAIRRRAKMAATLPSEPTVEESWSDEEIQDDVLRLIFICCHPAIPAEGRIALTLREVCGLTTEEIAKSFLVSTSTVAQRIVRAKAKIQSESLSYELPSSEELSERLASVLHVAYLVFSEGYYASSGYSLLRPSLSQEAIRLNRILAEAMPDPEVFGLLALMLFQESRRATRIDAAGDVVLLSDQDRSRWDRDMIAEAARYSERAAGLGPYGLQAAISAIHALSPSAEETDWGRIVLLYDRLLETNPSAVVELNRAVATAMRDGPQSGLEIIDDLLDSGELEEYGLAHSARADLLFRLGRLAESEAAYRRALELTNQEPSRRFLERRISEIRGA